MAQVKLLVAAVATGVIALVVIEDVLARRALRDFFADRERVRFGA
jgi:hypothetical protein